MIHEPTEMLPSEKRPPRYACVVYRCPVEGCGREFPGKPGAPCTGKGRPPSPVRKVWNVASAVAEFVADGCTSVDAEQYVRRLSICEGCERHDNGTCRECGCNLAIKAKWRSSKCPLEKWNQSKTEE